MDNYEILGLLKDASEEQVRAAFKELALKWHPDRRLNDTTEATAKFVEINSAYRAILREQRRARRKVDKETASSDSPSSSPSSTPPSTPKSTSEPLPTSHSSSPSVQEPTQDASEKVEKAQEPLHTASPPSSAPSTPASTSSLPGSHEGTESSGHASRSPDSSRCSSPGAQTSPLPSTPKSSFASLFSFSSGSSATSFNDKCSIHTHSDATSEDLRSEHSSSKSSTADSYSSIDGDQEGSSSSSTSDHSTPAGKSKHSEPSVTSPKSGRTKLRKQSKPADHRPDPYSSDFTPKTSPRRRKTDDAASEDERTGRTLLPEYDHPLLRGSGSPREWVYLLTLSLEELFHGKKLRFRIVRHRLSGKRKNVILDVHVPPGCQDGTKIVFKGSGHERKDGTRQDIVFLVEQAEHARFTRVHDDLVMDVRLPWVDSLMEEKGEVNFDGVDGKPVVFKINFPRDKAYAGGITIPHAGMPLRDGSERGKLVVRWEIVPLSLSKWETMKQMLRFKT